MRSILMAVLALISIVIMTVTNAHPARADWPLDKMNAQIEQTNVIVSDICSGTIIDTARRLVLTAYHCVVQNLKEVERKTVDPTTGEIKVSKVQEREPMYIATWHRQGFDVVSSEKHIATIVGQDENTDTALLQVDDTSWVAKDAAQLGQCDFAYQRGKVVYAVGNPGIIFDNSITQGIISAPARKLDFGNGKVIPLFQLSASVIGGNSGGAIYDENGVMIGTLTGAVRGADISLAVPICFARTMIKAAGFGNSLN